MLGNINVLGLGSGLELRNILDQLREADEAPLKKLETQKETLKEQVNQFTELNGDLLDIKSIALSLSLESSYIGRSINNSNESALNANVSAGAEAGRHNIRVLRLAQKSVWESDGVKSTDYVINPGNKPAKFSYQIGDKGAVTLEVPPKTTLSSLAGLINNDPKNPGVTAKIINTGDKKAPYKLVLTSKGTGEENRISINSLPKHIKFSPVGQEASVDNVSKQSNSHHDSGEADNGAQQGLDAEIEVDGIIYKRANNENINDILSGVTLNLYDTGNATINIRPDTDKIKDKMLELIDKINTFIGHIQEQTGYDEDNNPKLLTDNGTLRTLPSQLLTVLGKEIDTGGSIKSLYDLGLEMKRDGTFKIDETKLNDAVKNNFEELKIFLYGDDDKDIDGFASYLNDTLREWTHPSRGLLAIEQKNVSQKLDRLEGQIESTKARLDKKYEILSRQFAELDSFMSNMQSTSDYLTTQFDSLLNAQQKK